METEQITKSYEVAETTDDAHEHGVVFHQVEDEVPLRVEDADDDELTA